MEMYRSEVKLSGGIEYYNSVVRCGDKFDVEQQIINHCIPFAPLLLRKLDDLTDAITFADNN